MLYNVLCLLFLFPLVAAGGSVLSTVPGTQWELNTLNE